jgi:hypothetical protein
LPTVTLTEDDEQNVAPLDILDAQAHHLVSAHFGRQEEEQKCQVTSGAAAAPPAAFFLITSKDARRCLSSNDLELTVW